MCITVQLVLYVASFRQQVRAQRPVDYISLVRALYQGWRSQRSDAHTLHFSPVNIAVCTRLGMQLNTHRRGRHCCEKADAADRAGEVMKIHNRTVPPLIEGYKGTRRHTLHSALRV